MNPETALTTRTAVKADGDDFTLEVQWQAICGRLEPLAITIAVAAVTGRRRATPLTASAIRRLPIGAAIASMRQIASQSGRTPTEQRSRRPLGEPGPQRGRSLSSEQLAEVAAVYAQAYAAGDPVTGSVAQHFEVARSTAAKRIMAARAAGLLDEIGR